MGKKAYADGGGYVSLKEFLRKANPAESVSDTEKPSDEGNVIKRLLERARKFSAKDWEY
ncbi:MAG: hypothetical protein ABIH83_05110 [Candidatus Micrarchaeota archaeon]